ncbi:MAG: hypothetical protein L0Z51_06340 [Candidatus Latescibacteria bacterium]|nr:hypothetical protein [Candidatus Latescibacterota bacterium]
MRTSPDRTWRALAAVLLLSMALGACSSSQLVNMWKDPQYPQQPIERMYVIGFRTEPERRRFIEDAVVAELTRVGITAVASYRDFATSLPDTQQVVDVVRRNGYNGVVIVMPLGTETRETYVPGYVTTTPAPYYGGYGYGGYGGHGYWGGYYYPAYQTVYEPGYVEVDQIVRIRIDVWSSEGGGILVWSGTTESVDPTSADQIRKEVLHLVVPELRKNGVIANK